MTITTAIFAVLIGSAVATAFLYHWFQDEEKLPAPNEM